MKLFAFRCSSFGLGSKCFCCSKYRALGVLRFLDNWHYVVMKSSLGKTMDRLKASVADSRRMPGLTLRLQSSPLGLGSVLFEVQSTSQSIGQMSCVRTAIGHD